MNIFFSKCIHLFQHQALNNPSFLQYYLIRASHVTPGVKNLPANAGDRRDVGLIPGWGRSPGGGHGNPLQYSYLKNPMDRGAWWVTVQGVAKSRTRLNDFYFTGRTLSTCAHLPVSSKRHCWISGPALYPITSHCNIYSWM